MPETALTQPKSQPLPRRFFLGAVLAGATIAGGTVLGFIGVGQQPRTESFRFSRGTAFAPGEEQRLRGFLNEAAANPRLGLRITGHTGTSGDPDANLALSTERAEAARSMAATLGIPEDRVLFAGGVGGANPPPGSDDTREAQRAMARVTVQTVRLP